MASFYFVKTLVVLVLMAASLKGQFMREIQSPHGDDPTVFKIELEDTQEENQLLGSPENAAALYDSKVLVGVPGDNLTLPSKRGNTMSLIDVLDFVVKPKSKAKPQGGTKNIFIPRRPAKKMKPKSTLLMVYDYE